MSFNPFNNVQFNGLTPSQFNFLATNYANKGFIADPIRINNYSNPVMNTADRNWQEVLRNDPGNNWTPADKSSFSQNCNFGPHNAGAQFDKFLFPK
jgi:hypothetical protein